MGVNVSTISKSIVQKPNSLLILPFMITPIILVSLSHFLNTLWGKELSWKLTQRNLKSEYLNLRIYLVIHPVNKRLLCARQWAGCHPSQEPIFCLPWMWQQPNVSRYDQCLGREGGYQNCPWLRTTELGKIELVTMSRRQSPSPSSLDAAPSVQPLPSGLHCSQCHVWPSHGHSCLPPVTACTRNAVQAWSWTLLWILIYK